ELLARARRRIGEHATGRDELDQVGAARDLFAHGISATVDAIAASACVEQKIDVVAVAAGDAMTARRRDDRTGGEDARTRHVTFGDCIAQREDRVTGTAHLPQVANGGEAGFERHTRVARGMKRDGARRLLDSFHLVLRAELAGQVYVAIDETWEDEVVGKIDERVVLRGLLESGLDPGNAPVLDD